MGLDIRIPIGLMFGVIGLMLLVYGALTGGGVIYERSLGININVWWGALLCVFSAVMLWLGRRGFRR